MQHEFHSKVLITLKGGLIEKIEKDGIILVEIRDYDVDFINEEDIIYDEEGIPYLEVFNE